MNETYYLDTKRTHGMYLANDGSKVYEKGLIAEQQTHHIQNREEQNAKYKNITKGIKMNFVIKRKYYLGSKNRINAK